MNKYILSATFIGLLLFNVGELYFEKNITQKKIQNNFKIKSLFINYSFKKNLNQKKNKYQSLTRTFFKLYPDLYFLIIQKKQQIIFTANKNPEYNGLLTSFINTLKANKTIKNYIKVNNHHFYFNSSRINEFNIITCFKYNLNFWFKYLRNFIIMIILTGLIVYKYKRNKKHSINEYSQLYKTDDEESKEIAFNSRDENYKNLYEDNQKLIEQLENLSTFREVGLAINSILHFNQMLHVIMGVVINKMGVEKIVIYFIDEENKELTAKIGREGDRIISEDELIDDKIISGEGPLGKAMEYHTSTILSESANENLIVCPLIAKGNLIGSIKVSNKLDTKIFQETDKSLLKLLSSQIAIALNNARLYEMAITDGLTKLYVHRHFQFKLQEELLRHKRSGNSLSLIMIDIDHFKKFNDNYGHQAGDFVLIKIAKILKSMFRTTDSAFRYGGEEMSIILPETDSKNAYILTEKLRKTVENHKFYFKENELHATISLGVSTYEPQKINSISKEKLIKMADDALYSSKANGRNRTTLHKTKQEITNDNIAERTENINNAESTEDTNLNNLF